jgi:hypothetical protein
MTAPFGKLTLNTLIIAALILSVSYASTSVHAISYDTTDIIQPKIKDVLGRDISQTVPGSPVTLEVGIENNEDKVHPFVLLVEVRDSKDLTTFLAWQSGTLGPMEQ